MTEVSTNTLISITSTGELLVTLNNISASLLTSDDFITVS